MRHHRDEGSEITEPIAMEQGRRNEQGGFPRREIPGHHCSPTIFFLLDLTHKGLRAVRAIHAIRFPRPRDRDVENQQGATNKQTPFPHPIRKGRGAAIRRVLHALVGDEFRPAAARRDVCVPVSARQ